MVDPATLALIEIGIKLGTDIATDIIIESQQKGYTPDQLRAMLQSETDRKNAVDAAWNQMKADAGL